MTKPDQYSTDLDFWELLTVLQNREDKARMKLSGEFETLRNCPGPNNKASFDRVYDDFKRRYDERMRAEGES